MAVMRPRLGGQGDNYRRTNVIPGLTRGRESVPGSGPIFALQYESDHSFTMSTKHLFLALALIFISSAASAQKTIYSYAIGNWRNGPVVEFSPLFETTEMFTAPQLIRWVREQWPASFADTTDIDVLFFTDIEGGQENRTTLKAKYDMRKLQVNMIEVDPMPKTPAAPLKKTSTTDAPR